MNTAEMRDSLQRMLGPATEPVAVTFCDAAPVGIARVASVAAAGRSYPDRLTADLAAALQSLWTLT